MVRSGIILPLGYLERFAIHFVGWGTHPPDGPAQAEQGTGDDDDEDDDDDVGGDDDDGGDDKGDWRRR